MKLAVWCWAPGLLMLGAAQAETVTCESIKQQRTECEMDTRGEVRLVETLSRAPCEEGVSYGFNRHSVWVDRGCRAVFASEGSGGRPPLASGGRPAASNEPASEQIAACNAVEDRYGEVVSSSPLKPGAFEIILRYRDGDYVCNVEANGKVTYFEKLPQKFAADDRGGGDDNDTSARAGQGDFDASGQIPCAVARGQPMGQCPFKVARGSGGDATVVVTWPDGRNRAIFFEDGNAISADSSQADGYGEFKARKEADLYMISVGNERYEVPEAVVFGG